MLDIYKYPYYGDISEFNSKEYCFAYVIDEKEKTGELKNDTIMLSHMETRNNQVADRKYKIVFGPAVAGQDLGQGLMQARKKKDRYEKMSA